MCVQVEKYFLNLRSHKYYPVLLSTKGFSRLLTYFGLHPRRIISACGTKWASYFSLIPRMSITNSSTVQWKAVLSPTKLLYHLCHKSNVHIHVSFLLGFRFCFIVLFISPVSVPVSSFDNWKSRFSHLVFKNVLAILDLLHFQLHFRVSLKKKKVSLFS